jgi:hypothetical protein
MGRVAPSSTSAPRGITRSGFSVQSVWDLIGAKHSYAAAVPILLEHLNQPYPERVREGIASALAVPYAREGWPILLKTFREEPDAEFGGVKWALGLALGAMATDREMDTVIELALDKSLGRNRVPLIPVLGKSRDAKAREVLQQLRDDDDIGKEVGRALKRLEMNKPVTMRSISEK